jgi:DNA-binding beta-propeller fold protein YncE
VVASAAGAAALADEGEEKKRRRRLAVVLFLLLLLITLLTLLSFWYLVYRRPINELVPPVGQNAPPHFLFAIYNASKPVGVGVSSGGDRVYVAQSAGDRLVGIFDGSGRELGDLQPPSDGLPHTPVYVAVDPRDGDVYVSDRATGAVYVYAANGSYLRAFQPKVAIPGWQPLGVSLSPSGAWWITDLSAPFHRIEIFAQDGTLTKTIGAAGQFDYPNQIAFDSDGNAYLTDSNNGRLVVMSPSGQQLATIGRGAAAGNLGLPRGVATDSAGRLYVVDATGQFVHIYRVGTSSDWHPVYLDEFGTQGIGDGQFEYPNGVAVDGRDRIYVADRENNRVQVWGY